MGIFEKFIINQIIEEQFVLTAHARIRMSERYISDLNIIEAARNVESISKQESNETYLLRGTDSWGTRLSISIAVRDNVIIVTVFIEEDL